MRITMVIGALGGGGAERVVTLLANEFSRRGHNVSIVTYSPGSAYSLDRSVEHHSIFDEVQMKNRDLFSRILRRVLFYPRFLSMLKKENPDIVISFLVSMNIKTILASKFLGFPVIVTEHINYMKDMTLSAWLGRRWIYKIADEVTVLTRFDHEHYYSKFLNNVEVMPNPLACVPVKKMPPKDKVILASGSLDRWHHKGFDNLLKVFARCHAAYPGWKLQIAGGGEKGRVYLQQLASDLNIDSKVEFLGFCRDLQTYMQKASIFVLSSRYEGFGLVLIEAMSQGCACVSFDCIAGPGEIIDDGVDGVLVEDQNLEAMEQALLELMGNEDLRRTLALNAVESAKRYLPERIGEKWVGLLELLVSKKRECDV